VLIGELPPRPEVFDGHPEITRYGCWAHARRYFFEAQDNEPEWAEQALAEIGQLKGEQVVPSLP
jgi:hypothetical protein